MQSETHTVIVGGSLAGLLMGRVLANHCDRVTIIERDAYPDQPTPRKGVPHSRFPHTLMLKGQQILEALFPGLKAELISAGAIELDSLNDLAFLTPAGWAARSSSNLMLLSCSRDLLDWCIRRRVAQLPNVQFLTQTTVAGLLTDADHTKITGVLLDQNEAMNELYADLIVDASGKASHTPNWLRTLGYEAPSEIEVNAFVGYVARIYQHPLEWSVDWQMMFMPAAPPQQHRGGAIFPIEGDRWIISLAGGDRDYPPTDEAGFIAFARTLPSSTIADAIERSTPLTPIYAYYGNENRLRQYDRLSHLPAHLIVVGHAACSLNPTYGQAMTVAALEATIVDRFFQQYPVEALDTQTPHLQKQLAKAHQEAWSAATGMDYRYESVPGKSISAVTQFVNWYWEQLMTVVVEDATACRTFLEVLHLLKPSIALFHPSILIQVLVHLFKQYGQLLRVHSESKLSAH